MKYLIIAVIAAIFLFCLFVVALAFRFLFQLMKMQMMQEILSDDEKSERLCRLMKESTNCRIRLKKASTARKGKSSCPRPGKLRQLLLSLLNAAITAGVSALIKSLIEGYMG